MINKRTIPANLFISNIITDILQCHETARGLPSERHFCVFQIMQTVATLP